MRDRPTDAHEKVIPIKEGEIRHHKDEDKSNNAPSNLEPVDRGKHTADHNRARGLGKLRKALTMHRRGEKLY